MSLRDYQSAFVGATLSKWSEFDRLLGVAPTGAGKTIMAAELTKRLLSQGGRVLFLADAKELIRQGADKISSWCGLLAIGIEQGENHAQPGDDIVVATSQSIARRLDKWPNDYFSHIIIDEAHRNTLGAHPVSVLAHFARAKLLGITATPFRTDKRELSEVYQEICYEISLPDLIKQGYLSKITVRSVPCGVDLSAVRTQAGDYAANDLGAAMDPHLDELARILSAEAVGRKTVAFLPLVETSKAFATACKRYGLRAVHVDGENRTGLGSDYDVICNAQLLSTGWDEPSIDCVYICRPTKSTVLYQQMVGRGTRIHPGKKDLLLLDPLWLSSDHSLIRPARLVARSEEEAKSMEGREGDLLEAQEAAESDRLESMRKRMAQSARRASKTMDAIELALTLDDDFLAEYAPEMKWQAEPASPKQLACLEKFGIDPQSVRCKGHAGAIMDRLFIRSDLKLATVKQMKWLRKFGHPSPVTATFAEASAFLDKRFGKK
jgi:superfamily II DNA or RNA helicase